MAAGASVAVILPAAGSGDNLQCPHQRSSEIFHSTTKLIIRRRSIGTWDNPIMIFSDDHEESAASLSNCSKKRNGSQDKMTSALLRAPKRQRTSVRQMTFTCVVCTNDVLRASLPKYTPEGCKHLPHTCQPCINTWISSRLESIGPVGLTCPECARPLSVKDIKALAPKELYERYETLLLRLSLAKIPNFRWCIRAGCSSGQLHIDLNPIFRCAECNFRSCITHNVAWHYSLTCVEYDNHLKSISARKQQEREEAASRETAEKISKRCPGKDCGWRIEKSSGCDHMRCWKCGTEFCWICGAGYDGIWENGNSEHRSSCKHYRPIPQTQWQSRASNRVQPDVILTDL